MTVLFWWRSQTARRGRCRFRSEIWSKLFLIWTKPGYFYHGKQHQGIPACWLIIIIIIIIIGGHLEGMIQRHRLAENRPPLFFR
jgi:hypothetical protein